MKTLYLDCFSGISGDMTLGALIDCGADQKELIRQLSLLPCADEFALDVQKSARFGITGTDVSVRLTECEHEGHHHHHDHAHRVGYTAISELIGKSGLSDAVKQKALSIFSCIAKAEAQVHGTTVEEVHFHEVGAVDAMVDICGACIALEILGVESIICSPVNLGGGSVKCAHGILPVPAPATALILRDVPAYGDDPRCGELTTPTGAAIVKTLCASFGALPPMRMSAVGYGLGKRDTGAVNALRVLLGEADAQQPVKNEEPVVMLEANIDDMTGESLAFAADLLRDAGALDVTIAPVVMKKGRPAHVLSVLCKPADEANFAQLILLHTSTLGVRIAPLKRRVLNRGEGTVETPYGRIRYKQSYDATGILRRKAEYEDCAAAARAHSVPIDAVADSVRESLLHEDQT